MAERSSQPSKESLDQAWFDADCANKYLNWREAKKIGILALDNSTANNLEELTFVHESVETLSQLRDQADLGFRLMVDQASEVITRDVNPFANQAQPELTPGFIFGQEPLDQEVYDNFLSLPERYKSDVLSKYVKTRNKFAKSGKNFTEMPSINEFIQGLVSLFPVYQELKEADLKPEIIFDYQESSADPWWVGIIDRSAVSDKSAAYSLC